MRTLAALSTILGLVGCFDQSDSQFPDAPHRNGKGDLAAPTDKGDLTFGVEHSDQLAGRQNSFDVYSFTADKSEISIVATASSGNFLPTLYLYNNYDWAPFDAGHHGELSLELPEAGVYWIAVGVGDLAASGDPAYTVSLRCAQASCTEVVDACRARFPVDKDAYHCIELTRHLADPISILGTCSEATYTPAESLHCLSTAQ